MISHPVFLVGFLILIEISILTISGHKHFKKYFDFLPSVFWIYFLPMLASTFGLIDSKSAILSKISTTLLPMSLFILLMTVNMKAILKLGRPALIMFFAGSLGIILGAPIVFLIFKNLVGVEMWRGFACLAGSWTGGSANMIAVKEAMAAPDSVFLPMVIVDTVVPYVWMGALVALVGLQGAFDKWNKADVKILNELRGGPPPPRFLAGRAPSAKLSFQLDKTALILALAVLGGAAASTLANRLPEIKNVISTYAWTIILVSFFGIALSFTPARKLEEYNSSRIGYFILYFVLTSIGARANLSSLNSTFILIGAGFLLVFIHAGFILVTARLIKAPLFLAAVASQANIGGVASAPIVAEIYQPGLASVGLLLAILGNIIGTYCGILAGQLCFWVVR